MGGPDSARPASHSKKGSASAGTPPGNSARSPNPSNGAANAAGVTSQASGGQLSGAKKKGTDPKKKGVSEDEAAERIAAEAAERSLAEEAARSAAEEAANGNGEDDATRKSFAWRDLKAEQADRVLGADPKDLPQLVATLVSLPNYDVDLRQSILVDYYVYSIIFSKENEMTPEQASALFSIVKVIREKAVDQDHTVDQSFQLFKELIMKHSISGENSVKLFAPDLSRKIIDFVKMSFFQHFDLYKFCFTQEQETVESSTTCMTETPMAPLPLASAMTEEAHKEKLEQERLTRERLEREEAERIARLAAEEAAAAEMAKEAAKRRAIEQQAISAIEGTLEGLKKDVGRLLDSGQKSMAEKIEQLESKIESKSTETPEAEASKPKQKPTSKK